MTPDLLGPPPVDLASRKDITKSVLRICVGTIALYGVFAQAPLDVRTDTLGARRLAITVILLTLVVTLQIRAVARSPHPRLRAVEAIAVSFPLLILLFASTYYAMDQASSTNFNEPLTRTDAVYFAVTVFATVGFGDIVATSEAARVAVTVQMTVNMIVIGVIVRVLLATVQQRRATLNASASRQD